MSEGTTAPAQEQEQAQEREPAPTTPRVRQPVESLVGARGHTEPARTLRSAQPPHSRQASAAARSAATDTMAIAAAWAPQVVLHTGTGVGHAFLACCGAVAATAVATGPGNARHSTARMSPAYGMHRVIVAALLGGTVFAGILWWFGISVPTATVVEGSSATVLAVVLARWHRARWLRARYAVGDGLCNVVLVGTDDDALEAWATLRGEPALGYRIAAVVGDDRPGAPWKELPAASASADIGNVAERVDADGILVMPGALRGPDREIVLTRALDMGLEVALWVGVAMAGRNRLQLSRGSGPPLLLLRTRRAPAWQLVAKRCIDVAGAALMAVATAPLMAFAACAVKLQDGGPILIRSPRIGQFGHRITVLKFRTMVPDAPQLLASVATLNERTGGPLFKASSDPRVTRVGRFLRATSIDELPQLWNVLSGAMSLVGPRPALPEEAAQFDPRLCRRHEMRPGITGLWQAEARDNPCFSAYRRLDLAYIENWSLGLDLSILASTAHALTLRACLVAWTMIMPRRADAP